MIEIGNKHARWNWLNKNLLAKPPLGRFDLLQTVKDLGFVQIDTIQNVARAHHHILWSRNQCYRSKMIDNHLGRSGDLFEHFTHDASMIPNEYFPMWRRRFDQMRVRVAKYYPDGEVLDPNEHQLLLDRIEKEGPLSTAAFESKVDGEKAMWARPPHKKMLDYLWYAGVLTTSHRDKFRKYYDLTARVIPRELMEIKLDEQAQVDWLCDAALHRLGVANLSEIRKFWEAVSPAEVKAWADRTELQTVSVQSNDGSWTQALAFGDVEREMAEQIKPTSRLRIINPFDPAIRDRARLKRLFGFDYTIEIFVPAAKRKWGYYIYPLLQNDRFVGRIELKADRKKKHLQVIAFWQEEDVKWGKARFEALDKELKQFANFGGVDEVVWLCERL